MLPPKHHHVVPYSGIESKPSPDTHLKLSRTDFKEADLSVMFGQGRESRDMQAPQCCLHHHARDDVTMQL